MQLRLIWINVYVTKIYEKPKVSIRIIKNAKSFNTNNQKCKKATGTNERTNTDTPEPYDLFSRGLRRSFQQLINAIAANMD